ncbi:uncharacterized protein LOC130691558 [Daphnia carinata]|uniref:uncharacterized protein LOC130691558 n=1 Tax=Daphnia carinata TaxID=120202 RepID=UPI00257C404B|nr:uncharacterized protein LOC130691558 [Daphnia carinata]
MNVLVLLSLIIAAVVAIPAYPNAPAYSYLMNYGYPVGYTPEARRNLPDFIDSATTTTQSVASWQLKQLRRKWFILICMLDVSCPTVAFPEHHPWAPTPAPVRVSAAASAPAPAPFRGYPPEFRIDDLDEEMQHREMMAPHQLVADDIDVFETVGNKRAQLKSTNNLVKIAEFQMAQWIWRWNLILCLINPECPHVNVPTVSSRSGRQYPPIRIDVKKSRMLSETQKQPGVIIPVSFADE